MTRALERLVAERPGLLDPGEVVLAAGRARTVAGSESADLLPTATIWAVTGRRLFVFAVPGRRHRGLDEPLIDFGIAEMVTGARVEPFDDRDELLVVVAHGHPAMVVMDPGDAHAIADALMDVVGEPVATAPGAPTRRGSGTVGGSVSAQARTHFDPGDGDAELAGIIGALAAGDREPLTVRLRGSTDVTDREWVIRHLGGGELAGPLDAWVADEPDSSAAYLARGANAVWTAWERRSSIPADRFATELRAGELDLFWSLELDFDDPVPFTPLVRSALGLRIPLEELCMRFDESVRRGGDLPGVHFETVAALGAHETGTGESMLAFARSVSRDAAEGSALHAVVPLAHLLNFDAHERIIRRTGSFSSEAIREVALARMVSVDADRGVTGAASVEVRNIFAAAALRSGDDRTARDDIARAGGVTTPWPWSMIVDGAASASSIVDGREEPG